MSYTRYFYSQTVTNEETFFFILSINTSGHIVKAFQLAEGIDVPKDLTELEVHSFLYDVLHKQVDGVYGVAILPESKLVDSPHSLGDDQDTDLVIFDDNYSFGLQVRQEGCGIDDARFLENICNLDGEVISWSRSWYISKQVPQVIAEYAQMVCS